MNVTLLTLRGESRSIKAWARISGVPYHTVYGRLRKGWDGEIAVFSPLLARGGNKRKGYRRYQARVLKPAEAQPGGFRPCQGGYRAYPLAALDLLRRMA